jgi:hypothetical protein
LTVPPCSGRLLLSESDIGIDSGAMCGRIIEVIMAAGIFAAMLTPQEKDGAVHRQGFARLAHWLLDHGCHGIVPFGTTGEFASFTV